MNFREWSNPNNWDDDGNPRFREWRVYKPHEDLDPLDMARKSDYMSRPRMQDWAGQQRQVYADEDTIDLYVDYLERQIGVEFSPEEIEWLHSVGMKP